MLISHVVAMAENRVIGRDGGLPWHIPADLKRFKAVTMGKMVLMGRKTYTSIGRPLPGRLNLVVSRSEAPITGESSSNLLFFSSLDQALRYAETVASEWQNELCIIGGGEIYRQTLDKVDVVYLSRVHQSTEGDTSYPELPRGFRLIEKEDIDGAPAFTCCLYAAPG